MTEDKIKKIILSGCNGDVDRLTKVIDERFKWANNEVTIKNQWSYIVELMIITAKSLIPDTKKVGNSIDYRRFALELELWSYYRHGENPSLINAIKAPEATVYWSQADDSVFSRIVPIVVSNTEWDYIKEEVIKNILYTTGDVATFLESVVLAKLVHLIIRDRDLPEYDNIIIELKDEVIYLSQKDIFDNYIDFFRTATEDCSYNYIITFEKLRLEILNILNGINHYKVERFYILRRALEFLKNKKIGREEASRNFLIAGIIGAFETETPKVHIKDREFLEGVCSYLFKLRKSRISPETLSIKNYKLPDVFSFKENEEFFHTLLNRSLVIRREESRDRVISYIKTKSGIYRFFKTKNPH